jgi:anti-sigma factor RsiW
MTESELFTPLPDDTERMIDRLVDGELSAVEYRSLVAALDRHPGEDAGNASLVPDVWRRVALAFLEAQALRQELGEFVHAPPSSALAVAGATQAIRQPASGRKWGTLLAVAASFLLAFGLGVMLPGWLRWGTARGDLLTHAAEGPVRVEGAAAPPTSELPALADRVHPVSNDLQPVGQARLVLGGSGAGRAESGNIPIYHLTGDATAWPGATQPALSAGVIDELQRRGHKVERQEQFVPVELGDGRKAVIPIEQYQITPVSRRAY